MFEASLYVGGVPASEIIRRDVKEYEVRPGKTVSIAQIEVVGRALMARRAELLEEMEAERRRRGHALYALMVTDIVDAAPTCLWPESARPSSAPSTPRRSTASSTCPAS